MEKEAVELEYNGKTITAYVDKVVADTLNNDATQREFYSKSVLEALEKNSDVQLVQVHKNDENSSYEVHEKSMDRFTWPKEATALLIKMRKDMKSAFDAKNSMKKVLWGDIAKKLEEAGFELGEEAGERCRQKFVNIRHQYLNYLHHMFNPEKKRKRPQNKYQNFFDNNSGFATEIVRKPPPFYEEMRFILNDNTIPAKIPKTESVYQIEYYNKTIEEFLQDKEDSNLEDSLEADDMNDTNNSTESDISDKTIWSVGAINLLIRFRGETDMLFQQEEKPEMLWEDIANKLKKAGFDLGENASKKCETKFENLQQKYEKHKALISETNCSPIMPFYNELDKILCKNNEVIEIYDEQDEDDNCETIILQTVEADDSEDEEINKEYVPEIEKSVWNNEAVLLLLKLRDSYSALFDEKSNKRKKLWAQIAEEMEECGFTVGTSEKCRQKFANLQTSYYNHLAALKNDSFKSQPFYFKEMHNLMKKMDKTSADLVLEEDIEDSADSKSSLPQKKKFKSNTDKLLDTLVKLHKEDQKERRQQFNELKALLKKQTEQQERLLNILEQSFVTT